MPSVNSQRIKAFGGLSDKEISEWLRSACEGYFNDNEGAKAFEPLHPYLLTDDSLASDLGTVVAKLASGERTRFRRALTRTMAKIQPRAHEIWLFLVELAWRTQAHESVATMERLFHKHFLDVLVGDDRRRFIVLLGFVRNTAIAEDAASVRLLTRLSSYDRFPSNEAPLLLLRLCEISPSRWTSHVAALRASLHAHMTMLRMRRSEEAMESFQDDLATDLLTVIGFDRFVGNLDKLMLLRDAASSIPSDNWIWRSLLERTGAIEITDDGKLADANNPYRALVAPRGHVRSPPRAAKTSDNPAQTLANTILGENAIRYTDEEGLGEHG